jgi:small-conductance mechanosensitive channel
MNNYLVVALLMGLAVLLRSFVVSRINRAAKNKGVDEKRVFYIRKTIDTLMLFITIIVILTYTGLDIDDLGLFLGSFVAVLGVSLFAQWSILSNVTASVFIFFFFPYRVGDTIKILDGENTIAGVIKEIALFHIILQGDGEALLTFPTSLIFQRAVEVLEEKRLTENEEKVSEMTNE